ncbi:PHD finger protein [Sesamum angolense]|uniref:PHD finger protein n=1 Tax=Sesamum angolense TaxID=2727404 RepID=A0AAE2BUU6_9LAMI|nr:PHD finger protein [Sesamum angolense]
MESAVESFEARSDVVGEKRPAEEDGDVVREAVPHKRVRGGKRSLVGDVKKVAEMVLVLTAMGKMRGGKGPTDAEKELMAEARNRLAKVCEGFAPKDVFPRDAFGGVIEDLGLNKLKEQRLGFRPPKMSIAEKLLVSKRKMEKAEAFSLPSTPHSSRLQANSGAAVESHSASHPVRASQPDKSSHMSISSGSFQSATPLGHSTTANSTSLSYQLPTSEIRPIVSSALPSSHSSSVALPRVNRPHLRSDGRANGSSQPAQIQATSSANSTARAPTWSVQPPSALSSKSGSDNKVPVNMSFKLEGAAGVKSGLAPQTASRTLDSQTTGPLSQGTNRVQPSPVGNTHAEIGKIVQKLLQPRASERPTWNPPSREYMNKALTCQMCMSTVTEIDSILICDACEKGYHLKCLPSTNQKGVPRGEWHCGKCLSLSNGKPLPPKYGRVMRNINTPKVSSNSVSGTPTSSKIIGGSDEKVGQPKVIVNGNITLENSPTGVAGNNQSHLKSGSASVSPVNSLVGKTTAEEVAELKPNSSAELVMVPNSTDKSQAIANSVEASSLGRSLENNFLMRDPKESQGDESSNNTNQKEQAIVLDNPCGVAVSAAGLNKDRSSADGLHTVNWVGDPVQVLDEKVYYISCFINGHLYKTLDHVLVRLNGRHIPSKLQAMWEDKNTTTKWVTVNQCYFPGDLPEAVGRPCGLEDSEVYESTRGRALMAGLIEGPCQVLPPRRFAEERERRTSSNKQPNDHLPPLYLCK